MKKLFLILAVIFLVSSPFRVFGAQIEFGESYYLNPSSNIDDNLYVGGGNVNILGSVGGDLFAGGGNVMVMGPVSEDAAVAGGSVNISGNILKDLRVAGGSVNISGNVGGELMVAGGNVYINGTIGEDLIIRAGEVRLGPNALVKGNLAYFSPREAIFEEGAAVQGITRYQRIEAEDGRGMGFFDLAKIIKLVVVSASALILFYLFKKQTQAIAGQAVNFFWRKTGKGLVVLVTVPIAVILSFLTVIGFPLGFPAILICSALAVLASIFSVFVLAGIILKYLFRKENYELNWWIIVLSAMVLSLISLAPIAGWVFNFIFFLASFGSLADYFYRRLAKTE